MFVAPFMERIAARPFTQEIILLCCLQFTLKQLMYNYAEWLQGGTEATEARGALGA